MQHIKSLRLGAVAFILGLGALASGAAAAEDLNMWDGQWHFDASPYLWLPWLYTTVQLPPLAGGGNPTIETQPSDYLNHLEAAFEFTGTVRKGNWSLWTDLVYLNLQATPMSVRQIGLPGGDPTLSLVRSINAGIRATVFTLAPTYTVMNNDIGTLDVLVGLRYSSVATSISYEYTLNGAPVTLVRGGGFWPSNDNTDGLIGIKGALRLSRDGKWVMPFEADVGDGNENWQYNLFLGAGYRFESGGQITLGVRNLTYEFSGKPVLDKIRLTGPALGFTFRW